MTHLSSTNALDLTSSSNRSLKRRKVRKGTTSCWECRRRKKRCEFTESASTCNACQRIGVPCVSQVFTDTVSNEPDHLSQRLDQVEALVTQFVRQRKGQSNQELRRATPTPEIDRAPTLRSVNHERLSRGPSLTGYLYSVLPDPSTTAVILSSIKLFASPLQVSQTSEFDRNISHEMPGLDPDVPLTSHPVLVAKRLIQLAICLKQFNILPSEQLTLHLNEPINNAAQRYFDAASHFVMSQDYLVASLDGLETLMLQASFHVTDGDFQAAWKIYHRVANISQAIDLPNLAKELGSRSENLWFRITYSDRFLSLVLGLPFAIANNCFATTPCLTASAPAERLERIHAFLAGHIIGRNLRMQHGAGFEEGSFLGEHSRETKKIDDYLKKATRVVPTNWWLAPSLDNVFDGEALERTAKLLVQMHQYYLTVLLHQPYIVHPQMMDYDTVTYSKLTAASASRELLSRFLIIRNYHRSPSYRALDEKAFVASATLLFVHFVGHENTSANFFEHQRSHDLGIIEKVCDLFDELSVTPRASQSLCRSQILRKLMQVEINAANGCIFSTRSMIQTSSNAARDRTDEQYGVELSIPYFGAVLISGPPSSEPLAMESQESTILNVLKSSLEGQLSTFNTPQQEIAPEPGHFGYADYETDMTLLKDWIYDEPEVDSG
ncbi:hypothetical protein N7520_009838 [Penicillium odoratum]|uniref:uncharacterized protein n=1 Tax=Penicillium odoratum TaxID=1167516 RepID=UPI002548F864|nr:uncharacterized protein N7520_009838 [Penicillium odoratum]KAJ5752921.1 hypothetical protein N7520_009838 [Penicillium odoratum]